MFRGLQTLIMHCGLAFALMFAVAFIGVAVTGPTVAGNIRLHPGGTPVPLVSSINFRAGQTRSNNAVIPLSALGELGAYLDQLSGTAHLILDVNGYFK